MLRYIILPLVVILLLACNNPPKYTLLFDRVDGLKVGAPVHIAGLMIGKVTRINLKDSLVSQIAVDFELIKDVRIPAGSKFIIRQSLIGDPDILIRMSASPQFIQPNDTLAGIYAVRENVFAIEDSAKREKVKQSIKKIGEGIKELLQTVEADSTDSSQQY